MGNSVVFGIYNARTAVEGAIDRLRAEGFRAGDISLLLPERPEERQVGVRGAVARGRSEFAIDGVLTWRADIGRLAVPGIGRLIAAGAIVGALIGAGGSVLGIVGALAGFGIQEYEAKRYESRIRDGGILLSVNAADPDWKAKAKRTLEATGAEDVSSSEFAADLTNRPRAPR